MDVANLQIEGLCLAHAALHRLLISKGIVTPDEIGTVLEIAEAGLTGEDRSEELSPAHRDAVVFPLRLLRVATVKPLSEALSFADLTRTVGRTKQPYNDQL
jgi:hypothetical protein